MTGNLKFDGGGLIPAVIQDAETLEVLTLCYMNEEALGKTLETGMVHLWRRSRGKLMMKGEESGCVQKVAAVYADCENNSLLVKVKPKGAACHTGNTTCYFRKIEGGD